MRKPIIFAILIIILGLTFQSCGYKKGVRQLDEQSYIWFSGNTDDAIAKIDDNPSFDIDLNYFIDSNGRKVKRTSKTLYEVAPGKHEVVVERNGETIVHRIILINAGASKEVMVP